MSYVHFNSFDLNTPWFGSNVQSRLHCVRNSFSLREYFREVPCPKYISECCCSQKTCWMTMKATLLISTTHNNLSESNDTEHQHALTCIKHKYCIESAKDHLISFVSGKVILPRHLQSESTRRQPKNTVGGGWKDGALVRLPCYRPPESTPCHLTHNGRPKFVSTSAL